MNSFPSTLHGAPKAQFHNEVSSVPPIDQNKLGKISGSNSRTFAELLLGQAIAACQGVSQDLNPGRAMADALMELQAQDPLESALMSQALSVHFQAMQMMARSDTAQSPEIREQWLRLTTKLMTLFARQLEAISKYQRKGQQHMTIHHMNLEPGSNAVLGSVTHTAAGRRTHHENLG